MNVYTDMLRRYAGPQRGRVALLAVLLLATTGLQLASPRIVSDFVDTLQAGGALSLLMRAALLYLAVAAVRAVTNFGSTYFAEDVGLKATNALRADLARHCLHLDLGFHNTHTPGVLIERVDGDVDALSTFFSQLLLRAVANGLLLVGVLVVLWLEDWRLGLAFTVFAAIVAVLLGAMRDTATPHLKAERQASAELFGFIEERLNGTEDLRANGATGYTIGRLFRAMRHLYEKDFVASLKVAQLRTTNFALFGIGGVLSLILGAALYRSGTLSLGEVYLLYAYVQMLLRPVERLVLDAQEFQQASASLLRVADLYNTRSAIEPPANGQRLPPAALRVEFDGVGFAYAAGQTVLNDISFELAPGRVLGLLGRTGSGKSTLTRLLLRLYDPSAGQVRIGGVDVRQAAPESLRARVGIVTQEVQLFHATVRDNLTLFDETIPDAAIERTLDALGLGDWRRALPNGLDTVLAGGGDLSAGQAQLLAFARIFLRDPGLVILDEASSRLDPVTERLIERAVDRLLAGRTGIVIAHRLGTVQRADQVMILSEGRIVEQGERLALLESPESAFARLMRHGLDVEQVLA